MRIFESYKGNVGALCLQAVTILAQTKTHALH